MTGARSLSSLSLGIVLGLCASALAEKGHPLTVTPASDVRFQPVNPNDTSGKGTQIATLFGDMSKGPVGFLLKTQAGERPGPHTHSSDIYSVVVRGTGHTFLLGAGEGPQLGPGSTYFTPAKVPHDNHCEESSECLFFEYAPNGLDFIPAKGAGTKP
jgi:quercetin dioxygenase-like cupin family protein